MSNHDCQPLLPFKCLSCGALVFAPAEMLTLPVQVGNDGRIVGAVPLPPQLRIVPVLPAVPPQCPKCSSQGGLGPQGTAVPVESVPPAGNVVPLFGAKE